MMCKNCPSDSADANNCPYYLPVQTFVHLISVKVRAVKLLGCRKAKMPEEAAKSTFPMRVEKLKSRSQKCSILTL